MNISYDEIRRIHRLEKNTGRLVEVQEDFFSSLHSFMQQEKTAYLEGLRNFSSSKARDYSNLKKMIEEIFLIREKKLLNKALIHSRTGELSEDKMALEEKKTLQELLSVLSTHRSFLNSVFSEEKTTTEKYFDTLTITLLKDVPSFIGGDMKEYGPFEKNKRVELPFKIASLLVARNLAKQE